MTERSARKPSTHFGEMLSLYRASRRWTVRELAPQIGISPSTLSRIERGQELDAATLLKLWTWLLSDQEPTAAPPAPATLLEEDAATERAK